MVSRGYGLVNGVIDVIKSGCVVCIELPSGPSSDREGFICVEATRLVSCRLYSDDSDRFGSGSWFRPRDTEPVLDCLPSIQLSLTFGLDFSCRSELHPRVK